MDHTYNKMGFINSNAPFTLTVSRKKVPCHSSQEAIKIEYHNLVEEKGSRRCDNSGNGC